MKKIFSYALFAFLAISMVTCTSKKDGREWENVTIVNAYIDGKIQSSVTVTDEKTTINLPAGTPLDKLRMKLVVVNGVALDFPENDEADFRKPVDVKLKSFSGEERMQKIHIIAPPKLTDFFIEGVTIDLEKIFFTNNKLIVQVPIGTDLTNLKVTMNFLNGTASFQNGVVKDFTTKQTFVITGVDEVTTYLYDFLITSNSVGPAAITSIKINGNEVASKTSTTADIDGNSGLTYLASKIDNFADATIDLEIGFGNEFDGFTNGTKLDLFTQPIIKVIGTNGVTTNFKFALPKIDTVNTLKWNKYNPKINFGGANNASVAFSNGYVISELGGTGSGSTLEYYKLSDGSKIAAMSTSAAAAGNTTRNIVSDEDGKILAVTMSHAAVGGINSYSIIKWDSPTDATPVEIVKYIDVNTPAISPRTGGISITGKLSGDAVIFVPLVTGANNKIYHKYTVTGGVVNTIPTVFTFPIIGGTFTNFANVEQIAGRAELIITNTQALPFNQIILTNAEGTELQKKQFNTSNSKTILYKDRIFLAYVHINGQGGNKDKFKIVDITDLPANCFDGGRDIFVLNDQVGGTVAPGNSSTGTDIKVIDGKLYVIFHTCNKTTTLFCLE